MIWPHERSMQSGRGDLMVFFFRADKEGWKIGGVRGWNARVARGGEKKRGEREWRSEGRVEVRRGWR